MTESGMSAGSFGRLQSMLSVIVLALLFGANGPVAAPLRAPDGHSEYFAVQVVDRQTGRGVPLVELRTVNNTRYITDGRGMVAFHEPGLMGREVFFFVASHGYEYPKDGFGYRGVRLLTSPGTTAVIQIDRLNIAERLYRVTGQGIYRDSVLLGRDVPLREPVLNGQVVGQDSVSTCIYHGRLFWIWGDTSRPSYPLGHFAMAGAVSDLPGRGGLDPAVGVDLEYFVDENGFSRPVSPLKEPGLVWLEGLVTVRDHEGRERMVARHARLKDLGNVLERGLVVFNDAMQSFEPLVRADPDCLPYPDFGHATRVVVAGRPYYYFATPFPLAVRMRVEASWDHVTDPNRYEVLTALLPGLDEGDGPCRWVRFGELTGGDNSMRARVSKALHREKKDTCLYNAESGRKVVPHGGSVYFNAYRGKWIMIFVQQGGDSSFLGEVWYAEADTPVGPWAYARKIATHNKYSFYNPKQHPYFDQNGGRVIFFEGTYSYTFSGSEENATPRYDYNQIMYRLDLEDPRLVLPVAVYETRDERGEREYLLGSSVEKANKWDSVDSVAFYAIEPDRAGDDLMPIYAQNVPTASGPVMRLSTEQPSPAAQPLFCAISPDADVSKCVRVVPLYAYDHDESGRWRYSTQTSLGGGWEREETPLCRVWSAPAGPPLLDGRAGPAGDE